MTTYRQNKIKSDNKKNKYISQAACLRATYKDWVVIIHALQSNKNIILLCRSIRNTELSHPSMSQSK